MNFTCRTWPSRKLSWGPRAHTHAVSVLVSVNASGDVDPAEQLSVDGVNGTAWSCWGTGRFAVVGAASTAGVVARCCASRGAVRSAAEHHERPHDEHGDEDHARAQPQRGAPRAGVDVSARHVAEPAVRATRRGPVGAR